MNRPTAMVALLSLATLVCLPARGKILWSDPGSRVIHATPDGSDILGGKVKRDDKASDVLYFKFKVDPLSDAKDEPYAALFQLVESNQFRLGVGNALEAWGYSAAYTAETGPSNRFAEDAGEFNLRSAHPEAAAMGVRMPYELPDHNHPRTIVFRVQYVPGGDDLVTTWLEPNLSHGATAENQPEIITTKFKANASFDEIRLRHWGGGNGWIFSDMAMATSFEDFVVVRFWQTWWFFGLVALFVLSAVGGTVRVVEKRKYQIQLKRAEQQHALAQERARIAQDLHDDLGSGITEIGMLVARAKSASAPDEKRSQYLGQAGEKAREMVTALDEIVWAMNPAHDSLASLVSYFCLYADRFLGLANIIWRLEGPPASAELAVDSRHRHQLFLVFKEALTNVVRHSGATEVSLGIQVEQGELRLIIADNGRGLPLNARTEEMDGVNNMRSRIEKLGGRFEIAGEAGKGTTVRFHVPAK